MKLGILLLHELDREVLHRCLDLVEYSLEGRVTYITSAACNIPEDQSRGQKRADTLLRQCVEEDRVMGTLAVALTGDDLYVSGLNFVFGLANPTTGCAVVSWYRLGAGRTLELRLAKEIVHEVGHLRGLGHCNEQSCVMWFSNTLSETDRKSAVYCPKCSRSVIGRIE